MQSKCTEKQKTILNGKYLLNNSITVGLLVSRQCTSIITYL